MSGNDSEAWRRSWQSPETQVAIQLTSHCPAKAVCGFMLYGCMDEAFMLDQYEPLASESPQ